MIWSGCRPGSDRVEGDIMRGSEWLKGRIVVCIPAFIPSFFPDDVQGNCVFCEQVVRFRPNTPTPRALVCIGCFYDRARPGEACSITPETLEFIRVWLSATKC